ncbi:hypothetical protein PISMIDRAFT_495264 [Pisolithus microcarpus 441]|uniref:Uncharacterized protein n=1 Tax=Pisolithus microcarpus 441 TaxID=765257 RepID=A0A0C9ZS67_9AGAM|nr:hypothetical protein PISMIDRAFT_495264 [Pisolithus microcarpus 441]
MSGIVSATQPRALDSWYVISRISSLDAHSPNQHIAGSVTAALATSHLAATFKSVQNKKINCLGGIARQET